MGYTKVFQSRDVLEHAGEAEEGKLFDVESVIVVVAVDEIVLEITLPWVKAQSLWVGKDLGILLCISLYDH